MKTISIHSAIAFCIRHVHFAFCAFRLVHLTAGLSICCCLVAGRRRCTLRYHTTIVLLLPHVIPAPQPALRILWLAAVGLPLRLVCHLRTLRPALLLLDIYVVPALRLLHLLHAWLHYGCWFDCGLFTGALPVCPVVIPYAHVVDLSYLLLAVQVTATPAELQGSVPAFIFALVHAAFRDFSLVCHYCDGYYIFFGCLGVLPSPRCVYYHFNVIVEFVDSSRWLIC
jgi:hypothetical protein